MFTKYKYNVDIFNIKFLVNKVYIEIKYLLVSPQLITILHNKFHLASWKVAYK